MYLCAPADILSQPPCSFSFSVVQTKNQDKLCTFVQRRFLHPLSLNYIATYALGQSYVRVLFCSKNQRDSDILGLQHSVTEKIHVDRQIFPRVRIL